MKRAIFFVAVALVACGKKANETDKSATAPATSTSAAPSASAVAETKAGPLSLSGSYASKQADVRTPEDAPKFLQADSKEGVGDGTLDLVLPGGDGAVTGKASGALGAQTFSGWLEGGRLTGTLTPAADAKPSMWGLLEAKVEGAGDARSVDGTVRASSEDGKLVREATFKLAKK